MHCTSTYPTPFEHVQLGCIPALQAKYGVPVGFSDHTLGNFMAFAAVAGGANLFEKHFTVSRSLPGPDQQGSMEPAELARRWCGASARSSGRSARRKQIQPGEQDVRDMALHSVVTIRDIAAGATIGADDVWAKRPGTGIPGASARRGGRPGGEARDREGLDWFPGTISKREAGHGHRSASRPEAARGGRAGLARHAAQPRDQARHRARADEHLPEAAGPQGLHQVRQRAVEPHHAI